MRDQLFDQITKQVFDGESIMCCFPRRTGKTHLIVQLLERPLRDDNVLLLVSHRAMGEEVVRRCGRKIEVMTYRGLNGLRSRNNIDCVIFEEPGSQIKPERFTEAVDLVKALRCQVIFTFTPFVYSPKKPHPLKVLWDTAPYYKYQMTPGSLDWYKDIDKDNWLDDAYQTEVEGNWVAR